MKRYTVRRQNWPSESPEGNFVLHSDAEAAIKAAVLAERESCAKLAADMASPNEFPGYNAACREIAEAIRARGTTTPNVRGKRDTTAREEL